MRFFSAFWFPGDARSLLWLCVAIPLLWKPLQAGGSLSASADHSQIFQGEYTSLGWEAYGFRSRLVSGNSWFQAGARRESFQAGAFAGEDQQLELFLAGRSVAVESAFESSDLTLGSALRVGEQGAWAGTLRAELYSFHIRGSTGRTARWSLNWKDPLLPDSMDVLRMGFQTDFSLLQAGWHGRWMAWHWGSQVSYGWTGAPPPEHGRSFRDSSVAGMLLLEAAFPGKHFRYTSRLSGFSGFSQLQGLRDNGKDTKRFAYVRLGVDSWTWQHRLQMGAWTWELLGAWAYLRMFPTDHLRTGESLAANRLFETDLLGLLGHSFYRKSYQMEGHADLWLGGGKVGWERNAWKNWVPGWDFRLWIPYVSFQGTIQERTVSLLYAHTQSEFPDGELLVLLGRIQGHLEWHWNAHMRVKLNVSQWIPWVLMARFHRNPAPPTPEDPGDSGGVADESQDDPWRLGRDGLGISLSAETFF